MKFAQLLWLLEVHTFRLLCFVGCQERVPWHACWSWGHHPRVGFLAFVNSREHNVHSFHKLKIASSGRRGGVSSKGASFNFILPLHWAFRPEILANGMLASSPSPFPQFFLCWQGRNRKICRVFWVSVQNNVLFWRFTIFFFCEWPFYDEAAILHDQSWAILPVYLAVHVCVQFYSLVTVGFVWMVWNLRSSVLRSECT